MNVFRLVRLSVIASVVMIVVGIVLMVCQWRSDMTSTKRKVRKPVIAARRAKSKRSPGLLRALQIASCGPSDAVMAIPMEMLGMLNISEQRLVDAAVRKRFNSPDFQLMWA